MNKVDIVSKQSEAFEIIKSAVDKMVNTIRPTFGPAGNKVIIDKLPYRMVMDDGVQIARDFELQDPKENAIVKIVREVAIRANDRAGDGTTGALIMLQAILNEVSRLPKINGRKIELQLKKGLSECIKTLRKSAKNIKTKEDLKKVALVSFDDEPIAEMIADLYFKLGKDALITIDKSPTMETIVDMSEGAKIKRGYISPYMITNPERMETVIENPYILITDYRLMEATDLIPIMDKMLAAGKNKLVIIAENIEERALSTIVINLSHVINPQTNKTGPMQAVAINTPQGESAKVFLEDLSLLTGAIMLTHTKGDKLENAEMTHLGQCARFICRRDESIIVGPKGRKADIQKAVAQLRLAIETEKNESQKKGLIERLGLFTNTLAVIKVGAPTESAQKALKYKVEDAVNATKSAFESGVVCGGGRALSQIKTSSSILNEALKYPAKQLLENMDIDAEDLGLDDNHVMNVVTGKVGPFMSVGVVDPVDVLIAGVESAVSIASLLLTSSGMIVESQIEPVGK